MIEHIEPKATIKKRITPVRDGNPIWYIDVTSVISTHIKKRITPVRDGNCLHRQKPITNRIILKNE